MARPIKSGLDYFPHDTDASNDEKIEALRALYGNDGYAFYFILLERTYRSSGAELDVSDPETIRILAKKIAVPVERFQDMLTTALKRGCFDEDAFTQRQVLTSRGVKKRAEVVFEERRNKQLKYQASKNNQVSPSISHGESPGETRVSPPVSFSRESKEKESKDMDINNIYPLEDKGDTGEKRGFHEVSPVEITTEYRKEAATVWSRVLQELQRQVSDANYRTWLSKTEGLVCRGDFFVIGVPNIFVAEYLDHNLRSLIEKTIISLTRSRYSVSFLVQDALHPPPFPL